MSPSRIPPAMLLFALAVVSPLHAITLARDGKPTAVIVVRQAALDAKDHPLNPGVFASADQKVKLAARDLQEYVEKMSGAKLPIVSDEQAVDGPVVLVGMSKRIDALKLKIPQGFTRDRRGEGFLIRAKGDVLVLAGNEARPYQGTHYAVAELLYRLGVRWYMPTAFGEVVPKQPTIAIADVEVRDSPDFPLRTYWSHMTPEMIPQEYLWKLRNKMQPDVWFVVEVAGDSSLNQYLPDAELTKTRPELFAKTLTGEPNPFLPNMTNPETVRMVAEKMKAKLRERRNDPQGMHDWLGFSPNDGAPVDFNPETMKLNMGFPNTAGREGQPNELSTSEEWFTFANAVAAEVVKEFPDVVLPTTGYANRDLAPLNVKLHPNLGVLYSAIWADNLKALDNPRSWHSAMRRATLQRWTELSDHVFTYDYFEMLMSGLTPTPVLRRHAADFPLFKQWGLFGFFHERRAAEYMEYGISPRYFMVRLMWDADLDLEKNLREFYATWYGPAAGPMRAYWDALEETMETTPLLGHEDRILPYVYSTELLGRLERAVSEAEKLKVPEPYATHVRADRYILEHLKAYMAMHDAEFNGDFAGAVRQADAMFRHREELYKISPFFHMPERLDRTDGGGRASGVWYWTLTDRKKFYQMVDDLNSGKTGKRVALAPRTAAFTLDPGDRGRVLRWFLPATDRKDWVQVDTTRPYYLQVPGGLDETSMPYAGAMWYAFEIDIPRAAAGKPLCFYIPTISPQAWVWVNGEYAGRRDYLEPYIRPASLDLEIAKMAKPGKNLVVIRVNTGANRTQAPEGLLGRAFVYAPAGK
ncbi:MAG: DUF4838 domain-containing protein [Armatimonadota bacterium]